MISGKTFYLGLIFLVMLLPSLKIDGQQTKKKELYQEGEEFFQEEDFQEAIFYFLQLEQIGNINSNLKYKIGVCYMNMPGEETKAIPYFEEAIKHISLKYKSKGTEEKQAPLHSLFYLGNVYRINNQLSKALEMYDKFVNHVGYEGNYNPGMVDAEIKACERAKIIQDSPVEIKWQNLGIPINSPTAETHPVISGDEKVLVYLTSLKFYNAVYFSKKTGDAWSSPENINPQIVSDGEFYPVGISFDGQDLYLVKKGTKNSDIYMSHYYKDEWTPAKPLNKNINSSSDETSVSVTKDGNTMYFTSNRSGSRGFDIYKSVKDPDGDWGKAENLGKIINTKDDEATPSISPDGKTLYFSSEGHYNMGGFDIFYSVLQKDGKWSIPSNIGYPINTTNDNIGFQTIGDGSVGYISRIAPDSFGKEDIYRVEIKGKFIQKENTE
jgi:tetratricopeptide (TPR) repeat protein